MEDDASSEDIRGGREKSEDRAGKDMDRGGMLGMGRGTGGTEGREGQISE